MQGGSLEPTCPVCSQIVAPFSSLEAHVSTCLDRQQQSQSLTNLSQSNHVPDPARIHLAELEERDAALARAIALSEGHSGANTGTAPGVNVDNAATLRGGLAGSAEEVIGGVCRRIERYYMAVRAKGLQKIHLCWPSIDLYSSNEWGLGFDCGFRNIQMFLSSCLQSGGDVAEKLARVGVKEVPTVPEIQRWIELAWKAGFDTVGMEQLGGKLQGTQTWIGAVEVVALLRSWRLRAKVVDFELPDESARRRMLEWVFFYFENRCKGGKTKGAGGCYHCRKTPFMKRRPHFTPPLYLQHNGHSRTIIGVEKTSNDQIRLLVVDPTRDFAKNLTQAPNMSQLRYNVNSRQITEQPRFQIAYLAGNPLVASDAELESLKFIEDENR